MAEDEDDEQKEAQAPGPRGGVDGEEDPQGKSMEGAHYKTPAGIEPAIGANAEDKASSIATAATHDQSTVTDGGELPEEVSGVKPAVVRRSAQGAPAFVILL